MLTLLIASVTDMRGTWPTAKGHDICVCVYVCVYNEGGGVLHVHLGHCVYVCAYMCTKDM